MSTGRWNGAYYYYLKVYVFKDVCARRTGMDSVGALIIIRS